MKDHHEAHNVEMSAIYSNLRRWIAVRHEKVPILAPGDDGMPEPSSDTTPMVRARYLGRSIQS
jgi:hypothetical protein